MAAERESALQRMNILLALGMGFLFWALAGFFSTRVSLDRPRLPAVLRPFAQARGYALLMLVLAVSLAAGSGGIIHRWTQNLQPLDTMMPLMLLISAAGLVSGCCVAILLRAHPGD